MDNKKTKGFKTLPIAARISIITASVVGTLFGSMLVAGAVTAFNAPATPVPAVAPQQKVQAQSVTTTKDIQESEPIAFSKISKQDSTVKSGNTSITTVGVDGSKTKTYTVTFVNGVETSRQLVKEEVTLAAVDEVTTIGTYVAPAVKPAAPKKAATSECDSNYAEGCVPISSDVDCGGGSGNGPAYFYGVARVVGSDIYRLDGDGDGYACNG